MPLEWVLEFFYDTLSEDAAIEARSFAVGDGDAEEGDCIH